MGIPYNVAAVFLQADIPFCVSGDTGEGKSTGIAHISKQIGANGCYTWLLSQTPVIDLRGIPQKTEIVMRDEILGRDHTHPVYQLVPWDVAVARFSDPKMVIILDEFLQATSQVQGASGSIILDRMIGDVPIAARVVLATNPPHISGNSWHKMAATRVAHLNWDMSPAEFVDGVVNGWNYKVPILDASWVARIREKELLVAKFIKAHPKLLKDYDEDRYPPAFSNPRTWLNYGARWLAAAETAKLNKSDTTMGLAGCVGTPGASQFMAFNATGGIDIPAIIRDKKKTQALKDAEEGIIDAVFSAANSYAADSSMPIHEIATFYTNAVAALNPDKVFPYLKAVSPSLPRDVREELMENLTNRMHQLAKGGASV